MIRSRFLAAALLLACGVAACGREDATGPTQAIEYDDALAAVLSAAGATTTPDRRGNAGHHVFDRLAAEIPGFAGLYRTARCAVVVVVTPEGDQEHAIRVVKAVLEPLVERACPEGIRVDAARGQFTYVQLQRFLHAAQDLLDIRGVVGLKLDFQANKLVILVASRETASAVLEALPRVGVPAEAVLFRGGRKHDRTRSRG